MENNKSHQDTGAAGNIKLPFCFSVLVRTSPNQKGFAWKLQITSYKLQTNPNSKITNYKQRSVLRTGFKRLKRLRPILHRDFFRPDRAVCNLYFVICSFIFCHITVGNDFLKGANSEPGGTHAGRH
jgi:hypothetical protein